MQAAAQPEGYMKHQIEAIGHGRDEWTLIVSVVPAVVAVLQMMQCTTDCPINVFFFQTQEDERPNQDQCRGSWAI